MHTPKDRRRHLHITEKGSVLEFTVQYETKLKGHWIPVIRYDTAHGYAHQHVFHAGGRDEKELMEIEDYNEALTIAENDLRSNWQRYKATFLKEAKDYDAQ
jgi:hypothetical protein